MYRIIVESRFCAIHRLRLPDGTWEPTHGHDWKVRVHVLGRELDEWGMVADFHEVERGLQSVLAPLHLADLNACADLAGKNPTAEVVARHVFDRMRRQGMATIGRVEVTEAPGCTAVYEPDFPRSVETSASD